MVDTNKQSDNKQTITRSLSRPTTTTRTIRRPSADIFCGRLHRAAQFWP